MPRESVWPWEMHARNSETWQILSVKAFRKTEFITYSVEWEYAEKIDGI